MKEKDPKDPNHEDPNRDGKSGCAVSGCRCSANYIYLGIIVIILVMFVATTIK